MSAKSANDAEFMQPEFGRPHLVILGAGASKAALPDGDRNGRQLPVMNELVEMVGLGPLIAGYEEGEYGDDFEAFYSHLAETSEDPELLKRLESAISSYFRALELPEDPTLYDYLILCLRPKDVIATFNWDPLLWQAACRVASRLGGDIIPEIVFLHGNAAIGYCMDCVPPTQGAVGTLCGKCSRPLRRSRLLFPVADKDYASDPAINLSWRAVRRALSSAYVLTIFGYSAPTTDTEALRLMKEAWGNADDRSLESVEIIDIQTEDELLRTWDDFICREHYSISCELGKSRLMLHPRRSCEGLWSSTMDLNPQPFCPLPEHATWEELGNAVMPLIEHEWSYEPQGAAD